MRAYIVLACKRNINVILWWKTLLIKYNVYAKTKHRINYANYNYTHNPYRASILYSRFDGYTEAGRMSFLICYHGSCEQHGSSSRSRRCRVTTGGLYTQWQKYRNRDEIQNWDARENYSYSVEAYNAGALLVPRSASLFLHRHYYHLVHEQL